MLSSKRESLCWHNHRNLITQAVKQWICFYGKTVLCFFCFQGERQSYQIVFLNDMAVVRLMEYLLPQEGQKRLLQVKGTNLNLPHFLQPYTAAPWKGHHRKSFYLCYP